MNCTICGKAKLPGAMLCGPCKAALKRARYVTVQEDLRRPSIIDVRGRPRRATNPPAVASPTANAPPAEPSRPTPSSYSLRPVLIGVAAMALLGTVAYFGQQEPGAQATESVAAAPPPPPNSPVQLARVASGQKPASVVDVPSPQVASAAMAPMPAGAASSATLSDSSSTPSSAPPSTPATAASPTALAKAGVAAGGRRASPRSSATFATVNGDPPEALNPPPVPEKVAALPAPLPPPAPDRWQTLRESIAMCDREGLIGGIICGQKARIQYCEGYWGKVPQCPGPTLNPER